MIKRKQSFWETVLIVMPFIWSFVLMTNFIAPIKKQAMILCQLVLLIPLIVYIFDNKYKGFKDIRKCFNIFAVFAFYLVLVGTVHNDLGAIIAILLILGTSFSFSFLGYEFRRFSIACYCYVIVSAVIIIDFINGGITANFNQNTIAMYAINGVLFLCIVNDMQNNKFIIFNAIIAIVLSLLIWETGCRSVFVGFFAYLVLRYIFLNAKKISKWLYRTVCVVGITAPYFVMRIYLWLFHSPYQEDLDRFFKEHTGKILFTDRESIWETSFEYLVGKSFFIGNGWYGGNCHNLYVDMWQFCGIIGIVFYCVLFTAILFKLYKHINDPIIKSSVCCFLGSIIAETFECSYFTVAIANFNIILYLFIAIAIGRYMHLEQVGRYGDIARRQSE